MICFAHLMEFVGRYGALQNTLMHHGAITNNKGIPFI
jgi:hypothetical protein